MPPLPCILVAHILSTMVYHTKSGAGLASQPYCNSAAHPIYGTGQGSCASPIFWLLLSLVLIAALQKRHTGMSFQTPDGKIVTDRPIDRIVDDTTVGANVAPAGTSILEEGRRVARDWETLLFLSGGTLAPKKCFFYHTNWSWHGRSAGMINPENSEITLPQGDIEPPHSIQRKQHNQAHRTLGVRLTPGRQWQAEIQFLREKILRFLARIKNNILTQHEARIALRTRFEPSIFYSIGITALTEAQCLSLQQLA